MTAWAAMLGTFRAVFTAPGFAIFTAVLAFNLLGDSLRDALDPTSSLRKADAQA